LSQAVKDQHSDPVMLALPGQTWLDVGCGSGEMAMAIAQIVGHSGRVVGVDAEPSQIRQARDRVRGRELPVHFQVADVHELPFTDESFDGCRADRVFQHLPCRERALSEMIRVAKPNAWICVAEPDWDTLVIDADDQTTTRKVVAQICDTIRNGWSGRQLPRLFQNAGLANPLVVPGSVTLRDLEMADELYGIRAAVRQLQQIESLSHSKAASWIAALEDDNELDRFFCCLTGFTVCARRPLQDHMPGSPTEPNEYEALSANLSSKPKLENVFQKGDAPRLNQHPPTKGPQPL
jgi:ubiquinone/menaquinone biosynthesis C-methylase UbiE